MIRAIILALCVATVTAFAPATRIAAAARTRSHADTVELSAVSRRDAAAAAAAALAIGALPGAASAKSKRSLEFEARMAAERGEKMREEEAAAEEKKTALQKSKEAREAAQKARPIQEAAPRKERAVSSSGGGGGGVGISAKDVLPTFGQDKEDRGPGDASSASYKIASEKRKEQKAAAEKRLKSRKRNQTFIEMSKKQ